MARKKEEYVIGILFKEGKIRYVTSIESHHTARWEAGKEAITFSKEYAVEMCKGFAWNGISAIPILKLDWIDFKNYKEGEE